jgi:hypothetical protein
LLVTWACPSNILDTPLSQGPGKDTFDPELFDLHPHLSLEEKNALPGGPGTGHNFLHPVLRKHGALAPDRSAECTSKGQEKERPRSLCFNESSTAIHEIAEDVLIEWNREDEHHEPCRKFVTAQLEAAFGDDEEEEDEGEVRNDDDDEL